MPTTVPTTLSENAGLAFVGEPAWRPAVVTARRLESLRISVNPSGRPNADVMRGFVGLKARRFRVSWQVDFASHLIEQEAALYQQPFAYLRKRTGGPDDQTWWVNPLAKPELRTSLAKLDRFLVTAAIADRPDWTWVDAGCLPDHSLLAVARDDDFFSGVLQSRWFGCWWRQHRTGLDPVRAVASFPFPWAPRTPVGSLTARQQESRSAVARAARARDAGPLDAAVASAYGWPPGLTGEDALARLARHHSLLVTAP